MSSRITRGLSGRFVVARLAVTFLLSASPIASASSTLGRSRPACEEDDLLAAAQCESSPEPDSDGDDPLFSSGRFYPAPPRGDIVGDWVTAHLAYPASPDILSSDALFVRSVAAGDPPYRMLNRDAVIFGSEAGNAARNLVAAAGNPMSRAAAATALAWDLGLTPSIPWVTTRKPKILVPANPHARASMIKAGVDSDLYQKARVLAGEGRVVLAANLALAAQAMRDREGRLREPSSVAFPAGAAQRFMDATDADALTDSDLASLMRELETVLSVWPRGEPSAHGKRQLPGPWRVARLAVAYWDELRRDERVHPCDTNGMPVDAAIAGGPVRLCIDAATDRAVNAWYAQAYRTEIMQWRRGPAWMSRELRLLQAIDSVLPFWVGVLHPTVRLAPPSAELARQLVATQADDAAFYPEPVTEAFFAAASRRLCQSVAP